jgi:hypothetical protein
MLLERQKASRIGGVLVTAASLRAKQRTYPKIMPVGTGHFPSVAANRMIDVDQSTIANMTAV